MEKHETLAAIATPPGDGGIAIVRISGPDAGTILAKVFHPTRPKPAGLVPYRLTHGTLQGEEGESIDEVLAVFMKGPHSYTGEDTAEIHCHGGHILTNQTLRAVLHAGAIPAPPGAFTRRAFENGRLDLAQAEAVQQLIGASGHRAAALALRQLQGGLSGKIGAFQDDILGLLAGMEAVVDFPDEVDEAEAIAALLPRTLTLIEQLRTACNTRRAKALREGLHVVIAGSPNAGKSTLLNALLMEERAIVTEIPGTTRDVLTESLMLDGLMLHVSDTAGLRDSLDLVEQIGVARAQTAIAQADLCLLVLDASLPWQADYDTYLSMPCGGERLLLLNKEDLPAVLTPQEVQRRAPGQTVLSLSAKEGIGIDALTDALLGAARQTPGEEAYLVNERHLEAARAAVASLESAASAMASDEPLDLCAIDLRDALHHLGSITGDEVDERVLDRIFETFCVGK